MKWSKRQQQAHEIYHEYSKRSYLNNSEKVIKLSEIKENRERGVFLIEKISNYGSVYDNLKKTMLEIKNNFSESYLYEIPHFILDCHKYLNSNNLPIDLNKKELLIQQNLVITPDELMSYDKLLKETVGNEFSYPVEVRGISFGSEGLAAQVWYDDQRMLDFTQRLGKRVREEIPSMNFMWNMVHYPFRVINLTKFTGNEDKEGLLDYVDKNKNLDLGRFNLQSLDLIFSDSYFQRKNTLNLGIYYFD